MDHVGCYDHVIRKFGDWWLVVHGQNSSDKLYLHKPSGKLQEDPPDQVLEILISENTQKRLPVYEPTPYKFSAAILQDGIENAIAKEQLLDCYGDAAMVLRNMLTPTECENIIAQAEDFGLKSCGYSKRMRISDRVSVMGGDMASELFERARPFLPPIEVKRFANGPEPLGVRPDMATGLWVPTGLNPCFRICKYEPGGFFQPHYDGGFDYDRQHRSIKTFMLYLNDGFEGGPTTFYEDSQRHYADPDPSKVLYHFRPTVGSCLAFNHSICHDGGVLKTGTKYILRTEVMYRLAAESQERSESHSASDSGSDWE
jgi:hypothetical protein